MIRPQEYLDVVEAIAEEAVAQRKEDRERYISESVSGSEWTFNINRIRELTGGDMPGYAFNLMARDIEATVERLLRDKLSLTESQLDDIASRLTDIDNYLQEYIDEEDAELPTVIFDTVSAVRTILGIKEED